MPDKNSRDAIKIVTDTIKNRRTFKVLYNSNVHGNREPADNGPNHAKVLAAIASAGWAPFHYDRAMDEIAEPWRVDFLDEVKCREVAANFFDWFDDVKPTNKLPAMLNGCGCLVLVSWLPQFLDSATSDVLPEKRRQVDEEHLAATAAYIQNLILILTAHDFGTYWSSGGQFRTPIMRDKLGLQHGGRLLGAVFVDYNPNDESLERLSGKLRNRRSLELGWFNKIE
jgi:hypothetical protein